MNTSITTADAKVGDWTQVAENLVRHANGIYYLRAKVLGKIVRTSLKTRDLKVAKVKRNAELVKARSNATARRPDQIRTIRDALALLRAERANRPHVRPKTRQQDGDLLRIMERSLPLDAHGKTWSQAEAVEWWRKIAKQYSASVANKVLANARRMAAIMIERSVRTDDPTRDLKRIPATVAHRSMPSREEMDSIIAHIRRQKKRLCLESSRTVALLAFSGMRKGELSALKWADVGPEWLTVGASGRTKSKRFRLVPITAPLRAVLDEMRAECDTGLVAPIASPRRALSTACRALKLPNMRVHDLRHWFATWAIQGGTDIPTVAKWLGHSDGGALAMRTYGHVRDDHSLASAAKLK